MFIGHFAVGFAAKKAAPKVSLGTLFIASQLIDLIWPVFLLLGIEAARIDPGNTAFTPLDFYNYPYTHSLAAVLVWSLLFGGVYYAVRRQVKSAVIIGLAVLSHWVLDFVTHRPDLPLAPGSEMYAGLGLWNNIAATMIVEGLFFAGAVALYARSTTPTDRIGKYALWSLVGFLVAVYVANVYGPPPPNEQALAYAGLLQLLFIPWMYWIDKHRTATNAQ